MQDDLRDFFLIVANYRLPDNTERYIEAMSNVPDKVIPYNYVIWLRYGFERRLGRKKTKGFHNPVYETKDYTLFTDEEFISFERNRQVLIGVLDEIVGGETFYRMKDFLKVCGPANSLQSREFFTVVTTPDKCVFEKTTYILN